MLQSEQAHEQEISDLLLYILRLTFWGTLRKVDYYKKIVLSSESYIHKYVSLFKFVQGWCHHKVLRLAHTGRRFLLAGPYCTVDPSLLPLGVIILRFRIQLVLKTKIEDD